MLLTIPDLKQLLATLEEARREAAQGTDGYCLTTRIGEDGKTFRWEPKPSCKVGLTLRDGSLVEAMPDGKPGIRIPLGPHGRGFLAINPGTGTVSCAACREDGL